VQVNDTVQQEDSQWLPRKKLMKIKRNLPEAFRQTNFESWIKT
jgi:hypothetical protein